MQVRFPRGAVFPEDDGRHLVRGMVRIKDVWLGALVNPPLDFWWRWWCALVVWW